MRDTARCFPLHNRVTKRGRVEMEVHSHTQCSMYDSVDNEMQSIHECTIVIANVIEMTNYANDLYQLHLAVQM